MQNERMLICYSLNTKPTVARMINVISVFVSAMSQNGRLLESFFFAIFFSITTSNSDKFTRKNYRMNEISFFVSFHVHNSKNS